jgi:hypothetical protein
MENGDHEMSEQKFTGEPRPRTPSPFSAEKMLTPKATGIAGFTFAVFSMLGQGTWSTALSALFWGTGYGIGTVPNVMVAWGIGCLVMAGLAGWLARSTLRAADGAWEGHLARAAVLVAAVGAVLATLTIIGGLIHHT